MMTLGGLSATERDVMDAVVGEERTTVSADDIQALLDVSRPHANQILARLAKKGWLVRVKRGVYVTVPLGSPSPQAGVEDAWPLAMELFAPCYIAGWSAAEHWGLTEQIFNSVAVVTATPQRRRTQHVAGVSFVCRVVDERQIFGTRRIWVGNTRVQVSDPHRLIIDVLAVPALGGGARHTLDVVRAYWESPDANPERLLEYAERFGRGVVFKRLGFTAERFGRVTTDWLQRCREGMTEGVSRFDPEGKGKGRILSRWRLRVNVPLEAT